MNEETMIELLNRFEWLLERNRFVEARRLVKREIENLEGITEYKCKKIKINKGFCKTCENQNCNLKIKK